MVASTVGSSTSTFWKRRSSAASFSTYLRYSLSVVAPMQCSSPRASAGLSMLPASIAPSALPAPTIVCSSSMNRMMRPSSAATSFSTAFSRSSNSPRYLAPASRPAMSSDSTRLSFSVSGTSPSTMRCARPSTMAVLPTPGSPISTGLFLRAPLQHLDGAADLVVAADHRIELAGARALGQVERVLLQRLALAFGLGRIDASRRRAPPSIARFERLARQAVAAHDAAEVGLGIGQRQQEHLAGDELVAALAGFFFCGLQQRDQIAPRLHHLALALHLRQAADGGVQRRLQRGGVGAGAVEQGLRAVGLRQHRRQQVRRLDVRVVARHGQALRLGQGLLERGRQFVDAHG